MSAFIAVLFVGSITSSAVFAAPACSGGIVALTFDDGPTPETHAVLDALKLHNLKAAFFLFGWDGAPTWHILNMLTVVPPGGTFLMHDRMPNTLAAIPEIAWYLNKSPACESEHSVSVRVANMIRRFVAPGV